MRARIVGEDSMGNKFRFNFENKDPKKSFYDLGRFMCQRPSSSCSPAIVFFMSQTQLLECLAIWRDLPFSCPIFNEEKELAPSQESFETFLKIGRE